MFAQIKKLFSLTQNFFIYSFLLAVVVFFVQFSPAILQILGSSSDTPNADAQKTISQYIVTFLQWLSSLPRASTVIVGLFWAVCALLLYLLYIFVANIVISTRNEIVVDTDNAPKDKATASIVRHLGTKALVALLYFIYLVISLAVLIPYWMNLLHIYVYSGMALKNLGYMIAGIVGLTLTMYLISASAYLIWKYEESV